MIRAESIPGALRAVPQWIAWKAVTKDDGGTTKLPVAPSTGQVHDAHDPGIWTSVEWALAALESFRYLAGIGFVLTERDPFTGIDLDHCIGPDGQPEPWAQRVIDCFNSYTELSPSGEGIRIFIRATMSPKSGHKLNGQGPTGAGAIEIYDRKRYLTVTGDVILARDVEPRQEELDAFCRMRMPRLQVDVVHGVVAELAPTGLSDDDVLRMARLARNVAPFVRLFYDGDLSHYQGDASRADMALCNFLAFWANGDAAQVDRIFRQSALMRDKWDEPRGDTTYGAYTIAKVIGTTKATYHATVEGEPEIVPGKPSDEPIVVRASTVEPKVVEWLWPNRVPRGFISIFAGRTGIGKSFVTLDIVARVTTGAEWPDLPGECAPVGNVLILSEDPQAQVLVPRLIASGADLSKVWFMTWGAMAKYTLSDTKTLGKAAGMAEDPILIIIDPPTNFMGVVDENRNAEIRRILMCLVAWLEACPTPVALILITHVTKAAKGVDAIARVIGSVAWVSTSRIAHIFERDADDPNQALFLNSKNNLGPLADGLKYHVVKTDTFAKVEWLGGTPLSADAAMSGEKAKEKKPVARDAALWLTERFRERREWRSKDLYQAAKEAGFTYNAVFKDNAQIEAFPIRKWQDFSQKSKPFLWTAQGKWPDPPRPESSESSESVDVNSCHVTEMNAFATAHVRSESGQAPSERGSRALSDRGNAFGSDLKTHESIEKADLPIRYVDAFGAFGAFGSNFSQPSAPEGEEGLGRALRFLTGMLRSDRELKRPYLLEWAEKNGISESDLLSAALRLGVTKTLDGTTELWKLEDSP